MKNVFKKVLVNVFFVVIFFGCATMKHNIPHDIEYGTSMRTAYTIENGSSYQIDSIIMADTLPAIEKWMHMSYVDYETNKKIIKRMYIRTYGNGNESVYIIMGNNEPYEITKRITQK